MTRAPRLPFRSRQLQLGALAVCLGSVAALRLQAVEEVFVKNCAPCHGPDGRARSPAARKLGVKDLTESKTTDAEIEKSIKEGRLDKNGKQAMPAFSDKLSATDIQTLIKAVKAFRK